MGSMDGWITLLEVLDKCVLPVEMPPLPPSPLTCSFPISCSISSLLCYHPAFTRHHLVLNFSAPLLCCGCASQLVARSPCFSSPPSPSRPEANMVAIEKVSRAWEIGGREGATDYEADCESKEGQEEEAEVCSSSCTSDLLRARVTLFQAAEGSREKNVVPHKQEKKGEVAANKLLVPAIGAPAAVTRRPLLRRLRSAIASSHHQEQHAEEVDDVEIQLDGRNDVVVASHLVHDHPSVVDDETCEQESADGSEEHSQPGGRSLEGGSWEGRWRSKRRDSLESEDDREKRPYEEHDQAHRKEQSEEAEVNVRDGNKHRQRHEDHEGQ
eukprot:272098-Hanusia_phi.AAC.1